MILTEFSFYLSGHKLIIGTSYYKVLNANHNSTSKCLLLWLVRLLKPTLLHVRPHKWYISFVNSIAFEGIFLVREPMELGNDEIGLQCYLLMYFVHVYGMYF